MVKQQQIMLQLFDNSHLHMNSSSLLHPPPSALHPSHHHSTLPSHNEEQECGVIQGGRSGKLMMVEGDEGRCLLHEYTFIHLLYQHPHFQYQILSCWELTHPDSTIHHLLLIELCQTTLAQMTHLGYRKLHLTADSLEAALQQADAECIGGEQLQTVEVVIGHSNEQNPPSPDFFPFVAAVGNIVFDPIHLASPAAVSQLSKYSLRKIGLELEVDWDVEQHGSANGLEQILQGYDCKAKRSDQFEVEGNTVRSHVKASSIIKAISLNYSFNRKHIPTRFVSLDSDRDWLDLPQVLPPSSESNTKCIEPYIKNLAEKVFEENDITYLQRELMAEQSEFVDCLGNMADNFSLYRPFCSTQLQRLQDMLKFKIETTPNFQIALPNYVALRDRLEKCNDYYGQRKNVEKKDRVTDILYHHYTKDQQNRMANKQRHILSRAGKTLSIPDYVASEADFQKFEGEEVRWQHIYAQTDEYLYQKAKSMNQDMQDEHTRLLQFADKIARERVNPLNCLSCCEFFYSGVNIKSGQISRSPLYLMDQATDMKADQSKLKDLICYLLNNKGGVIMYDCLQKYREVHPVGEFMSEKLQEQWTQRVKAYCNNIVPSQHPQYNVEITFVPVVMNPAQVACNESARVRAILHKTNEHQWVERSYIKGVYVTRIKVKPSYDWRTHYWLTIDNKPVFPGSYIKSERACRRLSTRSSARLIKSKFRRHYVPAKAEEHDIKLFLNSTPSYFHDGECKRPDKGEILSYDINENHQVPENVEELYPYMSLLVARPGEYETIWSRLQRYAVECEIQPVYQHRRELSGTKETAILYHKLRFDRLINMVAYNPQFQFGGRPIILVAITEFLKLSSFTTATPNKQSSFQDWEGQLRAEHHDACLELFVFLNQKDQQEYYLRTTIKTSRGPVLFKRGQVFMHYLVKHQQHKVIFKNPKNYNKRSMSNEINNRMWVLYSSNESIRRTRPTPTPGEPSY